jgi:ABC-2 type transport system permease protein/oleandomycin transport system permease protein
MTANAADVDVRRARRSALRPIRDATAVAGRNLIAYRRVPQLLVFSTIQPVMPGIFVQTTVFGAIATAVGLATDLKSGLLERFRSLPMARSAVLAGRTTADLARNVFVAALMAVVGFAVGFRIHTSALGFLAGMLLVLLFGYVLSWVFATVGLAVGDPETAQAAAFPVMAPLVFASSAFVPVSTMPSWLQPFAEHQPVSVTASAVRALMIGGPTTSYVLQSLAWCAAILLVFVPVAVRRYRRAV